ncbi:MAG TPA: zf-HC2 domain-containing protein [Blastocatellia bacterium]|nr:zf-HC2 domain-containing protein [Blastocatellia bacterium]
MDNLLRVHLGRRAEGKPNCAGFDSDLANAYVEHRLSVAEVTRYEGHLSSCAPCRTGVVALARMCERWDETPAVRTAAKEVPLRSLTLWLASVSRPQWAVVAVGVIAIAVSIPLLVSQKNGQTPQSEVADLRSKDAAGDSALDQSPLGEAVSAAPALRTEKGRIGAYRTAPARRLGKTAGEKAGQLSGAGADQGHLVAESRLKKGDTKSGDQGERTADLEGPLAKAQPAAPRAQAEETKQLPLIDKQKARRLPSDEKDTTSVAVLKPGDAGAEPKPPEGATIKSEAPIAAPPAPRRTDAATRREIAQPSAKLLLRDSDAAEPARGRSSTEPMKIGKKKFFLIKDTWTDESYDPTKELPVITLIRDSDVYNEEIAKYKDLKAYLVKFAPDQRAIVVYRKTVYKVIPQEQK